MIYKKIGEKNKPKLLKEKEHLEKLLSRIAKKDKIVGDFHPNYPTDFGNKEDENASEVAAYEANIAEEHDLAQKLDKVQSALKRIEQGTYGMCLVGGEPMPKERLEAVPEAENCIKHERS